MSSVGDLGGGYIKESLKGSVQLPRAGDVLCHGVLAAIANVSATLPELCWLRRCDQESPAGTPTVHLETWSRAGREVTRRLRADMRRDLEGERVCDRRAGVTVGCQGIVTLPGAVHELGIATKPARTYMYRVVISKPVCQK